MVRIDYYCVGERSKFSIAGAREEIRDFFDNLPYFQPWVWKTFAAIGAVGFFIGLSIGTWAYYSLAK